MNALEALLDLELGSPTTSGNLALFPLLAHRITESAYLTLDEALGQQLAEVTEISEAGSVNQLRIRNHGNHPVLILDGEELVGAKQNRIVNVTILVPAASTIEIPVTCVEAGRWRYRSRTFAPAGRTHYASARAMKLEHVNEAMLREGSRRSDQDAVWAHIAEKSARLEARSETQAASAMYERVQRSLEQMVHAFPAAASQVGAVFVIQGRVVGVETFDCPETWRKQASKLIRSYGLDAMDPGIAPSSSYDPCGFLEALASVPGVESPALGLGTEIRFEGHGIVGTALVVDGRPIHALAFAANS